MPNMANITVKKNDGTTDITFTAMLPSAGDKSAAIWRSTTVGSAAAHHPELRMLSRSNGTGSARRVEASFRYPSLATDSNGKVNIADTCIINFSAVVPQGMVSTDLNEAVSQGLNLAAATLVKDAVKVGFAPT